MPEVSDNKIYSIVKFVQNSLLPIAVFDREMSYLSASEAWCKELFRGTGAASAEIFPGDELPKSWKDLIPRALAGEIVSSAVGKVRFADGEKKWLRVEAQPWYESASSVGGVIVQLNNVTALLSAKREAKKYRSVLSCSHDAIVVVDRFAKIESVNEQVTNWFQYSPEELIGQRIDILLPEKCRAVHAKFQEKYMSAPTKRIMGKSGNDLRARRKDGSEFAVDISLSPSGKSETMIVTAVIRDVSEQKKREGQLRFLAGAGQVLSETLIYDQIVAKIAELVVPEIADGCLIRMNNEDGARGLIVAHRNRDREAFLLEHPVKHPQFDQYQLAIDKIILTGKPLVLNRIGTAARPDEENDDIKNLLRSMLVHSAAFYPLVKQGKNVGRIAFVFDESNNQFEPDDETFLQGIATRVAMSIDNAKLYRLAREAVKAREEILSIVSHDLKNPLAVIKLSAQIMKEWEDPDANLVKDYAERIEQNSTLMLRLINDLLDFAKIQSNYLSFTFHEENFAEIIESSVKTMKTQIEMKRLDLIQTLNHRLPKVSCDAFRIAQVLMNLISNAIKFSPKSGVIKIVTTELENEVLFSISDSGPGIASNELEKVFDRFWQADQAKNLGTGLGLSIAQSIIRAHRGKIWVESEFGSGSTFYFTLPKSIPPPIHFAAEEHVLH